jgi:hypothetical protein
MYDVDHGAWPESHEVGEVRSIGCNHCQIARRLRTSDPDSSATIGDWPEIAHGLRSPDRPYVRT